MFKKIINIITYIYIIIYNIYFTSIAYIEIWLPKTGTEEVDILQKAKNIRAEIKEQTKCNASIGISTNILLARLATKKAKPNGEFFISPQTSETYIQQFNVSDLPGVGWSIENKYILFLLLFIFIFSFLYRL